MQNSETVIEAATKVIREIEGYGATIRPEICPWGIRLARVQGAWVDVSYIWQAKPASESRHADKTVWPIMGGSLVRWVTPIGD